MFQMSLTLFSSPTTNYFLFKMNNNYFPVILAGGFGTRTKEFLHGQPKALIVSDDDKTLLNHLLLDLEANGFRESLIVSNSLYYDQIKKHVDNLRSGGLTISANILNDGVVSSENRKGALGDLLFGLKSIDKSKSLLVFASDYAYWKSFTVSDILDFASNNKYKNSFITLARQAKNKDEIKGRFGCPELDGEGFVMSFEEKPSEPKTDLATIAFYVYRSEHLDLLKEFKEQGGNMDSPSNIIPFLLKNNVKVASMIVKDNIVDAGTPEDIKEAMKY